jgi:RNA-directed DNA polymerase
MSEEVRTWRIHLRSGTELEDLASWINPIVRGWMSYYGTFYRTALNGLLQRINTYLVRWAKRSISSSGHTRSSASGGKG